MNRRRKRLIAFILLFVMMFNNLSPLQVFATEDSVEEVQAEEVSTLEPAVEESPAVENAVEEPPVVEEVKEEPVEVIPETTENTENSVNDIEPAEPEPVVSEENTVPEGEASDINKEEIQEEIVTEDVLEEVEEDDEEELEEDDLPLMPSQDFEEIAGNIRVKVHAEEGTFYEGTHMKAVPVETLSIIDSLEDTIEESVASVLAVDITFYNKDGEVVEPLKEVNVSMTSSQISEMQESVVVHVDDNGDAAVVDKASETNNNVSFNANEFSIYAVVGTETISTIYNTSDGKAYEVTLTYGPDAKIPYGSSLKVEEIKEDTKKYSDAHDAVKADLVKKGEEVDDTNFNLAALDISIIDKDGNEVEPADKVEVDLKIKSLPGVENLSEIADTIEVQHHVKEDGKEEVTIDNYTDNDYKLEIAENFIGMKFDVETFSVYTVRWRNDNRQTTVHYGYMENGSFVEFPNEMTTYSDNGTLNNNKFLIYDFEGYHYSDHTYYQTRETTTPANGGTEIEPMLNLTGNNNNNDYRYYAKGTTNATNVASGSHIYMIYEKDEAIPQGGTAVARINPNTPMPEPPSVTKTSRLNGSGDHGDGTRTISLSIVGDTKPLEAEKLADVIVIFDASSSMTSNTMQTDQGRKTRLEVAQNALKGLAKSLLQDDFSNGQIRMSLITFNSVATEIQPFTSDLATYNSKIDGITTGKGTNWEDGLLKANYTTCDSDRATFVIFLSDGDPTFRNSRNVVNDGNLDMYNDDNQTYRFYREANIFGTGNNANVNEEATYKAALDVAKLIPTNNKNFYTIAFSDRENEVSMMQSLCDDSGGKQNFPANGSNALVGAFTDIATQIEGTIGYSASVVDGVTGLTNLSAKTSIVGVDEASFKYFKNNVEWDPTSEGADIARYNPDTGAVEWNLGSHYQLEADTTYTVEFLVWPSQTAIDYVTDLNNGIITYSDLQTSHPEHAAQIDEHVAEGGTKTYTLKTNTDLDLTYQQSTKVGNSVSPVGDPIPVNDIDYDVGPLYLDTMPLKIRKVFNDYLTAGEDRETEVSLYLQRRVVNGDGTFGEWEDYAIPYTNPEGNRVVSNVVVLSDANNWEADFYISPGLIASGTTYNPGYEFRLTEPNIDYHYELNSEIVKPMLVDLERTYVGDTDNNQALTGENVVKGGINIEKIVVALDKDGNEVEVENPDDTEFTIRGYILDSEGNPYTFDPAWDDREDKSTGAGASEIWRQHQNDTGAYHHFDKDGNRIGYKLHFASTGAIELKLKAGESVRFINVPQDSTYQFYEDNVPDNYESNYVITGENLTVLEEGGSLVPVGPEQRPTVTSTTVEGTVYGNVQHDVTVKNIAKDSNLEISKTVQGIETDQEFTFTINLNDETNNETYTTTGVERYTSITFTRGVATVSLKDGERLKIEGLPGVGNYSVTETEVAAFTADSVTKTGELIAGGVARADFVNTYSSTGTVDLEVNKRLNGKQLENGQFTFVLKEGSEELQSKTNDASGKVTFNTISYTQDDVSKSPITYKISEVDPGNTSGYTYDNNEITVVVTLTDDGAGHITATPVYTPTDATFINTYEATGEITFKGTKSIEGRPMTASDIFSFEVKEGERIVANVQNDSTGKINYPTIEYTLDDVGEHTYTVKETSTDANGITVDTNTYTVTVTVADAGDGTLTITPSDNYTALNFVNTYEAEGEITFEGTKSIEGRAMTANDIFSFEVKEGERIVANVQNDATGKINYPTINYTLDDVGEHTYTVKETSTDANGITVDTNTYTVTVTVADAGNGTLTVSPSNNYTALNFVNTYEAEGTVTFAGNKRIDGRAMTANDIFSFEVKEGEKVVANVQNDATGKINYPTIEYTLDDVGEHTYTVKETSTDANGVTVDTNTYTVTVTVADAGDGSLTVTPSNNYTTLNFVNTYEAEGEITFEGTKSIEGRAMTANDIFSFEVKEGENVVANVQNDSTGKINYPTIEYTLDDVGEHTYTVKETSTDANGITVDTNTYTVTVTVADAGNGTLTVSPSNNYTTLNFVNTYEAEGEITFEGTKSIEGRAMTASDIFSFEVKEGERIVANVQNDATGKINYPTINYTLDDVGEHTYTVKETSTDANGITVDTNTYTVTVTVADAGNGTLTITPSDNYTALNFVNTYEAEGEITFEGTKSIEGRAMTVNDIFTFEIKEGDTVVAAVENDSTGKINYPKIEYTLDDLGEHTYTVRETSINANGIVVDTNVYEVTVLVEDNGDGTLKITPSSNSQALNFINTYGANGSVTFAGTKSIDGRNITEDDIFTFTITENGEVIATVNNDTTGKIAYPTITYTLDDVGNHTYTVKETSTDANGITVDTNTYTVTVSVADAGDGTLTITPSDNYTALNFVNTYEAEGTVTFAGNKSIDGREMTANDIFSFEVKEGETVVAEVQNNSTGKINYPTITYTLDDVGEHTYTVKETSTDANGITVDTNTYTVTVNVVDAGDGTLTITPSDNYTALNFVNTYEAEGTVTFAGNKSIDGRAMTANDVFSFEVKEGETVIAEVQNDSTGKINYPTIEYTLDDIGEHTYTVRETSTDANGITVDTNTYTVTVTVADAGDGTLTVTPSDNYTALNFVNTYEAEGTVTFAGNKSIDGRAMTANDVFSFEVKEGETVIAEVQNDSTGKINYPTIEYTLDDIGEHTYTVRETSTDANGITVDTNTYTVTVTVADAGDGTLTVTPSDNYTALNFVNTYEAEGTVTFAGNKSIDGRAMTANDVFSFEVKEGETVIAEVQNDSTGKINYPTITYTLDDVGEHTYTVKETSTDANGITVDTNTYTVTVTVADAGDGTLTITPSDNYTALNFVNTYEAEGTVTFAGNKSIDGREMTANDVFSFEVKEGEIVIAEVQNDSTGKINYSTIEYTLDDVGEHTYTVVETSTNGNGITVDTNTYTVTVTVADAGDGTLTITPSDNYTALDFVNTYEAEGEITFEGTKSIEGRTMTENDVFTFDITENGTSVGTAQNDSTGKINYPTIEYTLDDVGEHTYTVKETSTDANGITVDTNTYTVTVTVADAGDGTLTITPSDNYTTLDFVNTYEAEGEITFEGTKSIEGRTMTENDVFTFDITENGTSVGTAQNDSTGKINYPTIEYTLEDVGEHTYTVVETSTNGNGITVDTNTYTVTVTVADAGNGTLTITPSDNYTALNFVNTYEAEGKITFEGTKSIDSRDLLEGETYTFNISDDKGNTWEVENDAEGNIEYPTIEYVLNSNHSDLGDYTYTVTETSTDANGITIDTTEYTVTVKVEDNGDGTLKVTPSDNYTALDFVNTYEAKGSITFKGTKSIDCRDLLEGEIYKFSITDDKGNTWEVENDAEGNIKYPTIEYVLNANQDDLGNHTYTVKETSTDENGITVATNEYEVTVTVEDNGDGTLKVTPSDNYETLDFVNTYEAEGNITFKGTKSIDCRDLLEGETFTFSVIDDKGNTWEAENDAEGNIAYPTIKYVLNENQNDLGDYTYTIKETSTDGNGITVDTTEYTVTVKVEDNGDGTLKVTPSDNYETLDFVNTYEAEGNITFKGTKSIDCRDLLEGETYTFSISDDKGNTWEVENDAEGKIKYPTIEYVLNANQDDLGNHTYTVKETSTDGNGITVATNEYEVTVTVEDNGDGTLKVTPSDNYESLDFVNTYEAKGEITFKGTKSIDCRDLLEGETYKFSITDDKGNTWEVENDAEGNIKYPTIEYVLNANQDDLGNHTYTVKETSTDGNGITVATNEYEVTVTVEDNGDGTLKVTPSDNYESLDFVNTYEAKGKITFEGIKTISGRKMTEKDIFTFEIKEGDTVIAVVENDAEGKIEYPTIEYVLNAEQSDLGDHTYTVKETSKAKGGILIDTTEYIVTVHVEDNGDGTLNVTSSENAKALNFVNPYKTINITVTKTWVDLDNRFSFRPDAITVRLKADGKEVQVVKIAAKDNWKYTFENLEEYSDGKKIEYTISEDAIPYYTTTISKKSATEFEITNSIIPMGGPEREEHVGTTIPLYSNPPTRSKDHSEIYIALILVAISLSVFVTVQEKNRDKQIRILNQLNRRVVITRNPKKK